ncbi:MAG: hypothetical protein JWQ38_486 [Flavipsychrobacter sp.]|nr:hypothetical protein [Flavipsychrobacter sp.]
MKKIMLTCAMICAVSVVSFAQNANQSVSTPSGQNLANLPSTTQMGEGRAKDMKIQYNLTDAQYKKSAAIETEFFNQQRVLHNNYATNPNNGNNGQAVQNKMIELMAQKDAKYKQMMTAEQYAKYDAGRPKMSAAPASQAAPATAPQSAAGHN